MGDNEREKLLATLRQEIQAGLRHLGRMAALLAEARRRGLDVRFQAIDAEGAWRQTVAHTDTLERHGGEVTSIRTRLEEIRALAGYQAASSDPDTN
jgi:hypothetical protein